MSTKKAGVRAREMRIAYDSLFYNTTEFELKSTSGKVICTGTWIQLLSLMAEYVSGMPEGRRRGVATNLNLFSQRMPKAIARDFEDWLALRTLANLGERQ